MSRSLFGIKTSQMPGGGKFRVKRRGDKDRWSEIMLPADTEAGSLENATSRRPLLAMGVMTLISLALLVTRLANLQLVNGSRNFSLAEGNRIRQKVLRAPRGVVYDAKGQVLVRNVASFDLTVTPQQLPKDTQARQDLYQKVASLVGTSSNEIASKAEVKGLGYPLPVLVVAGVEREKALTFDVANEDLAGFSLETNPIREYIDGGSLSHFLGYTGRIDQKELAKLQSEYQPTDYIGKLGLEKQYETLLRGVPGGEQTEVDAMGRTIKLLASKQAEPGSNLVLSIDKDLQTKLAEQIKIQMDRAGSTRASGVALNPKTGEVLAAVSLPGYDNNLFSRGIKAADYAALTGDKAQPLFNKVVSGAFPSGSVIKPLVASAALQEGVINTGTSVNDTGALEVPHQYDPNIKYTFRSYDAGGLGVVNVTRAIAQSSNVFFYTIGGGFGSIKGLGVDRLSSYYQKFGLGSRTGIDIPGETAGVIPTPKWKQKVKKEAWFTGDTYNMSVGQGDTLVSPLQMAVATSAVANGGTVYEPHLLKRVTDDQGRTTSEVAPKAVRSNFIDPTHLKTVREAMRQVVTGGTACCLIQQEVPVAVAAKTGTAETDPTGKRKPHAWFTAFAPYEDPQIVIVVLVENSGEGAEYAAPAVRGTLSWYFRR